MKGQLAARSQGKLTAKWKQPPGVPTFAEPAAEITPAERLAQLEAEIDRILEKQRREKGILQQRIRDIQDDARRGVAQRLKEINEDRLYGDDFDAYMRNRWGYTAAWAYQQIDLYAVSRILETANAGQAAVVAPVMRNHGEEAARQVVSKAEEDSKKITAATLRKAAVDLGYIATKVKAHADDMASGNRYTELTTAAVTPIRSDVEVPVMPVISEVEYAMSADLKYAIETWIECESDVVDMTPQAIDAALTRLINHDREVGHYLRNRIRETKTA